jgi:hypothetical protein
MSAILKEKDWKIWLGEKKAPVEDAKVILKTMDGVGWTISPEPKKAKSSRASGPKARPSLRN